MVARNNYSIKESLNKTLKVPAIYAVVLGLIFNYLDISLVKPIVDLAIFSKYSFSVLGMMIVGLGLSNIKQITFDKSFIFIPMIHKFIIWSIFIFSFIFLDKTFMGLFSDSIYKVLFLYAILPIGSSSLMFVSILKGDVEKISSGILVNILFSLFLIPIGMYYINL